MKDTDIITLAGDGFDLPAVVEGQDPPSEFRIFSQGTNETRKGPLVFDDIAASLVMDAYRRTGRQRLAGDWEHASLAMDFELANGGAPASHWFALEVRNGELWATDVKWTERAFEQLQRGEYAHFSPAVRVDFETNRVIEFISNALTNNPATIGQAQLIAASNSAASAAATPSEDNPMGKQQELTPPEAKPEPKTDPKPETVTLTVEKMPAAIVALTGKDSEAEAVATVTAWKQDAEKAHALSVELADLKKAQAKEAFEAAISEASKDGRLSPADLTDGAKPAAYIATLRAEYNVTALSAYLSALNPKVSTEPVEQPKPGAFEIDDIGRKVAAQFGHTPEDVKKFVEGSK